MWIHTIIPEFVVHIIFGLGILGIFFGIAFGVVPFINRYRVPILLSGGLLFIVGLFLEGTLFSEKEWQLKVKELEAKIAKLEVKAVEKNIEIVEKIVTETVFVKEKGKDIIKYVDRIKEIPVEVQGPERERLIEIVKFVNECKLPVEIINIHNKAATMNKKDEVSK